jgi:hypothetical protein
MPQLARRGGNSPDAAEFQGAMRKLALLAMTAVVAASLAGPAAAKQKPKCRTSDDVIAQNRYVRVWEHRGADGEHGTLWACRRADGEKFALMRTYHNLFLGHEDLAELVRLNRRFVGFEHVRDASGCEGPPGFCVNNHLLSFDTQAGHRRLTIKIGESYAKALVVTRKGALAWAEPAEEGTSIRAADAAGTRTLDTGRIDPRSLAVELTIVSWKRAGEEHFARLR